MRRQFAGLWLGFLVLITAVASPTLAQTHLVMVEQPGCQYCALWHSEIGPAYDKTEEGRFAPLVLAQLQDGPPDGTTYARRVTFTPTFILLDGGMEVARLEGYPGDDFFWPLLSRMLHDHTTFPTAQMN